MSKGILPLVAGILGIVFILAVAAVIFGFFSVMTKTSTSQLATGFALQVNYTKAALDVIDASCLSVTPGSTANVTVALANVGGVTLTSPQFYFRDSSQEICTSGLVDTLNPGASKIYRINCTLNNAQWTSSDTLTYVRVIANYANEKSVSIERTDISDSCS